MSDRQNEIERFTHELTAAGLRIALLPPGEHARAIAAEVRRFPPGQVRDFAACFLGLVIARARNRAPRVKTDSPMAPKLTFQILGVGVAFVVVLFAIAALLLRFTTGFAEALALTAGGLFLVCLIVISLAVPRPSPSQQRAFNVYLALAAAAVGAGLPGFLSIEAQVGRSALSAGGALALFVLVIWWRPVGRR